MIKVSELSKGIELCIDNGKRLLEDALILQKNKKFSSAIPLFILGYEEINKGVFLEYKLDKQENVSDGEYDRVFGKRSHSTKNIMYFEITRKKLEELSDKDYFVMKDVTETRSSIRWHKNKDEAINQTDGAIPLVAKFNQIKKDFLYIDYLKNKWYTSKNRFSGKLLESLCIVLYNTAIEPYLKTKFYLELNRMGYHSGKVIRIGSEEEKKMFEIEYSKELEKLHTFFQTPKWINARNLVTKMIQSWDIESSNSKN